MTENKFYSGPASQQDSGVLPLTAVPSVVAAYEKRIKSLEDRKIVLAENIAHCGRPVRSFDETLRTAFDFLASPCNLWASDRLDDKRTVAKAGLRRPLGVHEKRGV